MKLVGMTCAAVIAIAGIGGAHAQSTCGQVVQLGLSNHAQVKAMRGDVIKQDDKEAQYKFKASVAGFDSCTIYSDKAPDKISGYLEHHLWCDGESDTPEQATAFVEAIWSCTNDMYTERAPVEAWLDEEYRIIEFSGEVPTAGRESGPVEFGETEYARVVLEKAFDTSEAYTLHVYWSFVK